MLKGDSSAGLTMAALPMARAGAIFRHVSMAGTFHGTMAATTPTGSRREKATTSLLNGTESPLFSDANPEK